MIARTVNNVLSVTLALAAVAPLHAAPTASAKTTAVSSVTYHIQRHGPQVSVEDADGKTLTTFTAATPLLHGLWMWSATGPTAATDTPRALTLTLSDQNGRRLWSTPVSAVYPQTVSVNYNSAAGGTLLTIITSQDTTPNPEYPPASGLSFTIRADGRPLSFGDAAHQYRYVYQTQGFSVVDPDGKVLMKEQATSKNSFVLTTPDGIGHLQTKNNSATVELNGMKEAVTISKTGTETFDINGTKTVITQVKKDGKTYSSFPWNGHNVLVEQSCTITVTSDGDLRVNAPSPTKTAAKK